MSDLICLKKIDSTVPGDTGDPRIIKIVATSALYYEQAQKWTYQL